MVGSMKRDEPLDGVTKFTAKHVTKPLSDEGLMGLAARLAGWRQVMVRLGHIGQDPARYDGIGFGNVSARIDADPAPPGSRRFIITGTQTGGRPRLGPDDFCVVQSYDHQRNAVSSEGAISPSSESMTHGTVYDCHPGIRAVMHAHAPEIWRRARRLGLPTTDRAVLYGTPEMAREVRRLFDGSDVLEKGALAMLGHEDGVVVFGETIEAAGARLAALAARAYEMAWRNTAG